MKKIYFISMAFAPFLTECAPVKLEAPDKPIVINMNMNIKHEVKVKVKDDLKKVKKTRPDIFA